MKQETITIIKEENKALKRKAEKSDKIENDDVVYQLKRSLEDLKKGRYSRIA
jgi:hypothetical protein